MQYFDLNLLIKPINVKRPYGLVGVAKNHIAWLISTQRAIGGLD